MISLIQHFEADFLWKVSLKISNSVIILKTLTLALQVTVELFQIRYANQKKKSNRYMYLNQQNIFRNIHTNKYKMVEQGLHVVNIEVHVFLD